VKVYQFWSLHTLIQGRLESLLNHPLLEVMEVKRRVENPMGFAWSRDNVAEISPTVGFVDTIVGNNNLIVHQLLEEKATPYPVLLTLFRRTNGIVIVSLRSRNGEALKIAEKLQGPVATPTPAAPPCRVPSRTSSMPLSICARP